MTSKQFFNLQNENDIAKLHKLLLDDSEDEDERPSCSLNKAPPLEVPDEEYDTDASENIEERDDSETEQSDTDVSSCEEDENFYHAYRKKGKKIIDSYDWKKQPYSNRKKAEQHNVLPGVIGRARNVDGILNTWMCLFDHQMIDSIVAYTNQYIDIIRCKYNRERNAMHTNETEIKAFIGLLYIAGMHKAGRKNLQDLWDSSGFGVEIFRLVMSEYRFKFLQQTLRFDNRGTREKRKKVDRLAPVRDLFQKFVQNCQHCYTVGEDVTIDEKLEAFRGRCSFVQYIPSKPAKYGIKIFAAVDSKMFYTCNMEIYAGRQPEGPFETSNKSTDVVERLVAPLRNSGRNICADNWFSDVTLLRDLAEKYRLSFVGSLKKNKWQIPLELKDVKKRAVNSSIFAFRTEGTLVSYVPQNKNSKKNVLLISSMHYDGAIDESTGDKKEPEIIRYYNKHKIAVDIVDKMCSSYNVQRGTRRWPMVVFYSMLNVAGINSQIIYFGNGNKPICRRLFLRQLGRELIEDQLVKRSLLTTLPRTLTTRIIEILPEHRRRTVPTGVGATDGENSKIEVSSRKRCKPCLTTNTRRLTKFSCKSCGQYLCLQHCSFVCADGCESIDRAED